MHRDEPKSDRIAAPTTNDLRALANRFHLLWENERTRLAQELHDNLTQKLTVVSLELSLLDVGLQSEPDQPAVRLQPKIKEMSALVNDMIQGLRKIKAELRPKVLDEFGLVAALEWEAQVFQKRTGVRCSVQAFPEDLTVEAHMTTELFRMFQAIMANVQEHAQASHVRVAVSMRLGVLQLLVEDDGIGMSHQPKENTKSLGLLELRERSSALGGELFIQSKPGKGTSVSIKVPVVKRRTGDKSDQRKVLE